MHEIFAWLYENQQNLVITSGISKGGSGDDGREVLQDTGLYDGHEYSLLKLALVRNKSNKVIQMVHLRNPHGEGEFNGDWSDSSSLWNTIPKERREQLLVKVSFLVRIFQIIFVNLEGRRRFLDVLQRLGRAIFVF